MRRNRAALTLRSMQATRSYARSIRSRSPRTCEHVSTSSVASIRSLVRAAHAANQWLSRSRSLAHARTAPMHRLPIAGQAEPDAVRVAARRSMPHVHTHTTHHGVSGAGQLAVHCASAGGRHELCVVLLGALPRRRLHDQEQDAMLGRRPGAQLHHLGRHAEWHLAYRATQCQRSGTRRSSAVAAVVIIALLALAHSLALARRAMRARRGPECARRCASRPTPSSACRARPSTARRRSSPT